MRSMNAVLLDWWPKHTAHVRVATAKLKCIALELEVQTEDLLLSSQLTLFCNLFIVDYSSEKTYMIL